MISKYGSIIVYICLLSLITMTASCRQHRTPKSITFKRIANQNSSQLEDNKNIKERDVNEELSKLDSLFDICIPAPLNDRSEKIILRKAYILSYNKDIKNPNWVAWLLSAEHADGNIPRRNDYREDMDVPSPRATNEDYKGEKWTRGHMCRAGDNKWDEDAMRESNLLTNICPQHASLNSGLWNKIEQDSRNWAKKYGDLFIVCGPILYNKEHETIGANKIVVPEAFFKVILCLTGTPKAIGFVVKNNEGKKKKDQFVNTVDEVEKITGIDFFPNLPDDIENKIEAYANLDDWR